jgi:hypothetical protein
MVSVVVPSFNYARFIGDTLRSIRNQTYRNIEIVVSDNCSTDDSWKVIQDIAGEDGRFSLRRNDSNVGIFENIRRSFEVASGQLLMLVNADDRLLGPNAVARLVGALESRPGLALATSRRQFIDQSGNVLPDPPQDQQPVHPEDAVVDGRLFGDLVLSTLVNRVSESSTIFRKNLLPPDADLYRIHDRTYSFHVDIVWWLKLLAQGDIAYIVEPLGQYRMHGAQESVSLLSNPASMVAWYDIIQDAKALGFLSDRSTEQTALCALRELITACLPLFRGSSQGSLTELFQVIAALKQSIFALGN